MKSASAPMFIVSPYGGICIIYYLRCKLFHGEVPDSTFKLKPTDEDWEIEELGKLLEIVVFELLEHNHIFR